MAENGSATREDVEKAKAEDIHLDLRNVSPNNVAAGFFTEEVRRELADRYGSTQLYEGGLSVRTTLDPRCSSSPARRSSMDWSATRIAWWHGPIQKIDSDAIGVRVGQVPALTDVKPWELAVVLEVKDLSAKIGTATGKARKRRRLAGTGDRHDPSENAKWARKGKLREVLAAGDVVYVEPIDGKPGNTGCARSRRFRAPSSPWTLGPGASSPWRGLLVQPKRIQPGDPGDAPARFGLQAICLCHRARQRYTPSTVVVDGPIEIDQGPGLPPWRPEELRGDFRRTQASTLGIEHSKNLMTVRLAKDIGMPLIVEYAKKFGIYDDLKAYLPMALGAGETTVLRLVTAYAMLDNGGRRIKPTLIDRIQDRWGHTIFKHDERICASCDADDWHNQPEPKLIDKREQVIDPMTAYQITSMMQGVIQRGTGVSIKTLGRTYIAGKTGTTNDAKDLWFVGYTANLVVGLYIGYDQPRSLGDGPNAQAATYAAPIFRDFMGMALKGKPDTPFRVPEGIKLIRVSVATGLRAGPTTAIPDGGVQARPGSPDYFAGGGGSPTRSAVFHPRPIRLSVAARADFIDTLERPSATDHGR